jgi:hypothetical protein
MKTLKQFKVLTEACTYKPGWEILCKEDDRGVFVQISVTEEAEISLDMITGKRVPWKGGKHYMSPHMCDSEVVGVVFGAIRAAEEHELREWFRFCRRSIFNPHLSVYTLAQVASKKESFDVRENAMTMEESV